MSVLIFVDGVIRKERDLSIILDGSALYKSLNENYRVILVTEEKEKAEVWLKMNNLSQKTDDIVQIMDSPLGDNKFRTVEMLRSKGKIDFVITDDLDLSKQLLEVGILTLVFLHPRYVRPEFRPDGRLGAKSWLEITEELDKQQGLYLDDARITDEDEGV